MANNPDGSHSTRSDRNAGRPSPRARHASHTATGRAARRPARFSTPASSVPVTAASDAKVPLASDASSIGTIRRGQGARVTTRDNASEAAGRARRNAEARYRARHPEAASSGNGPERSPKRVALLVVLAVAALLVLLLLVRCVTSVVAPGPGEQAAQIEEGLAQTDTLAEGTGGAADDASEPADPQTEQAAADGAVSYRGLSYGLATQESGRWGVVATDASGSATTLFELEGTPVAIARSVSTLLIVENRDGVWDVACYVIGGQSVPSYVTDGNGTMVQGSSEAASATISGQTLSVTDTNGQVTDVSIE